jgi:hypothetical protein
LAYGQHIGDQTWDGPGMVDDPATRSDGGLGEWTPGMTRINAALMQCLWHLTRRHVDQSDLDFRNVVFRQQRQNEQMRK